MQIKNFNIVAIQEKVREQFEDLNPQDPSAWPALPRYGLLVLISFCVLLLLWFLWITDSREQLQQAQDKEVALKEDFKKKLVKAINLDLLKKQREQVQQYVLQLEKQLPSKAEMDALLSDINQAGLGRSLQFELFRPGQVVVRDYYAELPIALKVTGRYHDIGSFASDVANLSRIVTLNGLAISQSKENVLSFEATAKTYRYLDPDEIQAQKKAAGVKK
ncbi:type 4a pilus biogenesis protein PilO [Curvibacter sp. CHRR-16]|uniref:type 4a pilus biogenesis protein PilO n=1 Tax=Curvibacter sp. CHRR-16 TaxID=2835872 RepID=UPI001BD971BB|nr:type 4a pilus biogenesis protein PilO [Curvibacter sp. CHRR-16]MBT0569454.1 type 4a pilus biogenesis protein PilO [Curvibacter sp. CHRR-16]